MLEPAHIAGVSKTPYVLATPRCLQWRRGLQRTSTNHDLPDSDPLAPSRRSARRRRGDRRSPRPPVAGVLVRDGRDHPCDARDLGGDRTPACGQPRSRSPRGLAPGCDRCRGPSGVAFSSTAAGVPRSTRQQLLDEAISKYGSEAEAARWVATPNTSAHVSGDAVDVGPSDAAAWLSRARRRVRAVPDLRQRALALRTAPRSRRSGLPSHVRRPDRAIQGCSSDHHDMKRRPLAALAIVALIGAGCSSGSAESGDAPTSRAAAAAPTRTPPIGARPCGSPSACATTASARSRTRTRRAS